LIGYCLVVIQYVDILNSAGIATALIARREKVEDAANAAFVANILFGIGCFLLAWIIAPFVAAFFKAPEIVPLFRAISLSLPFTGLGVVPDTMLKREMRFNTVIIADISRNFMKGAVSVVLALLHFGVWSLVWGQVIGVLTGSVLSWILAHWKPTWKFDRQATRSIVGYGSHIILLETAGAFRNNVDYLLVGRILGAASLGFYTMSYRMPELIIRSLNYVIGDVSLPALASVQSDRAKLQKFYFGYIRFLSMFVFPVGIGLAFTAPVFIPLFLSDKWNQAIVPTSLISIALCITALGYVPGVLYKAISRPDILNKLAFTKMPIAVLILWFSTRWGIVGVAAGQIAIALISVSMDMLVANRVMSYSFRDLFGAISPALYSTLSMAAVLFMIGQIVPDGLIQLSLMVGLGGLTYFGVFWILNREALLLGVMTVRSALIRKKKTSAQTIMEIAAQEPRPETRVSAVITAYNSEAYIAEAIQSVLKQSRAVDEIVVVDDGSTDHTRQVVAEFADQGIKFIQQQNRGAGGARNRGIRETSGEVIAFLDADDVWLEDKTFLQLEYLNEHPKAALVSGFAHWWNVDKDRVRISGRVPRNMTELRREILVHNVLGNPSMVMMRRSALVDVGLFQEEIRWGQDWELWMRLVEKHEAGVIPQPVTIYRWHRSNLSHIRSWERLLSYWHVSLNGIRRSRPAWRRPWLLARSWSDFTYRRAMYAIQYAFPRWRHIWYAVAALIAYPFESTREKLGAVVRAFFGDRMYQAGKRVFGLRAQARGQE
jgi:O-antigen/teichoic acid export membrane protein/glycosyltransferase involved in cell wall biosynthesis